MSATPQDGFAVALRKVKSIGPAGLSNQDLLLFCHQAFGHFEKHLWSDARPFFVELWRRIEAHRIPGIRTKTEACRQIGCSLRCAEMIVAGTAKDSKRCKSNKGRTGCEKNSGPKVLSDQEYADVIARYAEKKLEDVKGRDWERFREICSLLQESFREAATGWSQ